ncbi:MAG TPA: hypothetical protein VNS81_11855 [Nocardioides sp.]|nr:hypothetical protein [Nocardioides sp.]
MSQTGFLARNNGTVGSVLSLVALFASIGLGAGIMFTSGTRGVAAILTVLLIAGGAFSLLFLLLAAVLRTAVPDEVWESEEAAWREARGLDAPSAEASRRNRRKVVLGGSLALAVGLCLSVVRAALS